MKKEEVLMEGGSRYVEWSEVKVERRGEIEEMDWWKSGAKSVGSRDSNEKNSDLRYDGVEEGCCAWSSAV